jgi:hypothetical protein
MPNTELPTISDKNPTDLPVGNIQFYDNYLPALQEGDYNITVETRLDGVEAQDLPTVQQSFTVSGPRFTLANDDIYALFPAANSRTMVATSLPYIVFNKRTLPWERLLRDDAAAMLSIPWLALLVFEENELPNSESLDPLTKTLTGKVSELLQLDAAVLKKPDLHTVNEAEAALTCQVIRIAKETFEQLLPQLLELPYLSHCRQVNTSDKVDLRLQDKGWFSVTVSNRFPKAPEENSPSVRHVAHLVSLEGFEEYLAGKKTISEPTVQLISLTSWSFDSLATSHEDFTALVNKLLEDQPYLLQMQFKGRPETSTRSAEDSAVRQQAQRALDDGCLPLLYHTRTGEQTLAWYRGPLTPKWVAPLPALSETPEPIKTSDSVTIYDPSWGVFDLAYAAAWQLGRLLALADGGFTEALLAYRWQQHQEIQRAVRQNEFFSFLTKRTVDGAELVQESKSPTHLFFQSLQKGLLSQAHHLMRSEIPPARRDTRSGVAFFRVDKKPSLFDRYQERQEHMASLYDKNRRKRDLVSDIPNIPNVLWQWLSELYELKRIPFQYLVADARALPATEWSSLLPPDSIRFFHVDSNWQDQLINGALSIGLHTQQDESINQTLKTAIKTELGQQYPGPLTGFLLRSQLVSDWPGLEVRFEADHPQDTPPLTILRRERLAPTVLFYLIQGKPRQVTICEPQEQLCFGIKGESMADGFIQLRQVANNVGTLMNGNNAKIDRLTRYLRQSATQRVLHLAPLLADGLVAAIRDGLGLREPLTPAQWSLQLMREPTAAQFNL